MDPRAPWPEILEALPDRAASANARGRRELSRDLARLEALEVALGYRWRRPALLRAALTLQTWVNEHPHAGWTSNACLEFFGDSVLGIVATEELWRRHPAASEGDLTRLRADWVSERALVGMAMRLSLGDFVWIGRGDEQTGGRTRPSLLADAFEAVLAALFFDARAAGADALVAVASVLAPLWPEARAEGPVSDSIDERPALAEACALRGWAPPAYVALGREGHGDGPWRVAVELRRHDGSVVETFEGQARSQRGAERHAAARALAAIAQEGSDPAPAPSDAGSPKPRARRARTR